MKTYYMLIETLGNRVKSVNVEVERCNLFIYSLYLFVKRKNDNYILFTVPTKFL
jgi:hypothetical protein